MKHLLIIILSLIAIIITTQCNAPIKKEEPKDTVAFRPDIKPSMISINDLRYRLKKSQKELLEKESYYKENKLGTPSEYLNAMNFGDEYLHTVSEVDTVKDVDVVRLKGNLKNSIIKQQLKVFPILRKKYAELLHSIYWQTDIEVEVGGNKNTELTFIGGHFASNMNKQDFIDQQHKQFEQMRFKKIILKWIKHDDESTYYKLDVPSDATIVP